MAARLTRASRYPHVVSGPHRHPKSDRHLAYLLVLQAGALNAVGFTALGIYTSHTVSYTHLTLPTTPYV